MNAPPEAPPNTRELSFGQVLTLFWRGRWTILLTTLLVTAGSYVYSEQVGTIWRAWSRVFINSGNNSQIGPEVLALGFGANNYAQTQAEVMVSSEILRGALERFGAEFPQSKIHQEEPITVPWLKYHLSAKVGADNDIITVALSSQHKAEACALVNEVVEGYQQFQRKMQRNSATELYRILETDRKRYENEHELALSAIDEYRKRFPTMRLGMPGAQDAVVEQQRLLALMRDLEQRQLAAETDATTANKLSEEPQLLAQLKLGQGATDELLVNPPQLLATPLTEATLLAQVQNLKNDKAKLLVDLQPGHRRIAEIDREIDSIQLQITAQKRIDERNLKTYAATLIGALDQRVDAIKAERQRLQPLIDTAQSAVLKFSEHELDFRQLSSRAERTKQALDNAYAQLQRINIDPESRKTIAYVLDYAEPEQAQMAAGQPIRLPIGVLLGLLAGTALAWLQGMLDSRVRSADELRRQLPVPVLATLPRTSIDTQENPSALTTWASDHQFAEAARTLRTAVYFGLNELDGDRIQITSAEPGPGKSTVASTLAIAMAKAGHRTLLIDADLRKPTLIKRWQAEENGGISRAIMDDVPLSEVTQQTELDGLSLLVSGPPAANPTEILNSEKFAALLEQASAQYDRVIIDSSPILPVADARILATKCHTTLLAVSGGSSTTKDVTAAYSALDEVNAHVLGVVMNKMPKGHTYGFNYTYGYGYGYGYGRQNDLQMSSEEGLSGVEVDITGDRRSARFELPPEEGRPGGDDTSTTKGQGD